MMTKGDIDLAVHDQAAVRPDAGDQQSAFVDLSLDPKELKQLIKMGHNYASGDLPYGRFLTHRLVICVFEQPSTRTRLSTLRAAQLLGGQGTALDPQTSQMARGETIADTMRMLNVYADVVLVRSRSHERFQEYVDTATIPVINGLTDRFHPCQVIADILAFERNQGSIEGQSLAWIGDDNNMLRTWLQVVSALSLNMRVCLPRGYRLDNVTLDQAQGGGGTVRLCATPAEAVLGVKAVMTDTWTSLSERNVDQSREEDFRPLQVTDEVMRSADPDAVFMHCLPAYRDKEVAASVIDGAASIVSSQAACRVAAMQAVLSRCFGYS